MIRQSVKTLIQSVIIAATACLLAIIFNSVRADGIPLITDVPYDIFAECKDSEAEATQVTADDLVAGPKNKVLYIDARPAELFAKQHVTGAINVPYSALFGASDEDVKKIAKRVTDKGITSVIVYGAYVDPEEPENKVDFGEPLSLQLIEAEIGDVKYVKGGLETLIRGGVQIQSGAGGTP